MIQSENTTSRLLIILADIYTLQEYLQIAMLNTADVISSGKIISPHYRMTELLPTQSNSLTFSVIFMDSELCRNG